MICRAGRLCVWHYLMTPGCISHLRHTQHTMSLVSLYQLLSTVALSPCCLHISCSQLLLSAPICPSPGQPCPDGVKSDIRARVCISPGDIHSCIAGIMMWPTTEVHVDWTGNLTYKSEPSIAIHPCLPYHPSPPHSKGLAGKKRWYNP